MCHKLTDCASGKHDFKVVTSSGSDQESTVVRWCKECGSVVVDTDYDGRTNPGVVMPIKSPKALIRLYPILRDAIHRKNMNGVEYSFCKKCSFSVALCVCEQQTPSDTEMINWLQKQTKGYGRGWIVRDSTYGHGMILHETSRTDAKPSVREAIMDAMKNSV